MASNPPSAAPAAGLPMHALLVPLPVACFAGTLITDIAYSRTADMMWADFSAWLLTAGLLLGGLAAAGALIGLVAHRRQRGLRGAWPYLLGAALVLLLSLLNAFVHSRDAWTSVVPTGLTLSAVVVVLMAVTGWLGLAMVYRPRAGVAR